MAELPALRTHVKFGKRTGVVKGYGVLHRDLGAPQQMVLVDLDSNSAGWLRNEMTGNKEAFISLMAVDVNHLDAN